MLSALLLFEDAPATGCTASSTHDPKPLRFVWHHVQPQEAGGQSIPANLVQVCDSCHYSVHRLMWIMRLMFESTPLTDAQKAAWAHPPRRVQLDLASRGFNACVTAGTVLKIPDEGLRFHRSAFP